MKLPRSLKSSDQLCHLSNFIRPVSHAMRLGTVGCAIGPITVIFQNSCSRQGYPKISKQSLVLICLGVSIIWSGDREFAINLIYNKIYYSVTLIFRLICFVCRTNCASPTSGEAYRDRWLTTNFELLVEIFLCRHVSM